MHLFVRTILQRRLWHHDITLAQYPISNLCTAPLEQKVMYMVDWSWMNFLHICSNMPFLVLSRYVLVSSPSRPSGWSQLEIYCTPSLPWYRENQWSTLFGAFRSWHPFQLAIGDTPQQYVHDRPPTSLYSSHRTFHYGDHAFSCSIKAVSKAKQSDASRLSLSSVRVAELYKIDLQPRPAKFGHTTFIPPYLPKAPESKCRQSPKENRRACEETARKQGC